MGDLQAAVEATNAHDLVEELRARIADARQSLDMAEGLLDDLAVYLPAKPVSA